MKSGTSIVLVSLLVLGAVGIAGAVPGAGAVDGSVADVVDRDGIVDIEEDVDEDDDGNATGDADGSEDDASDEETRPGERLAGVIGVQGAEIDGEVEDRSLERRVAADRGEDARADAIDEQLRENDARLDQIERRQAELREQRATGEIREGEYRARMARLVAQTASIDRTTNRSAAAANELPHEQLEARGIDDDRIQTLRNRTNELSGPEVAEMARGIAGPNVGGPAGGGERPAHAGQPSTNVTPGSGPSSNASDGGPLDNANDGFGPSTDTSAENTRTESTPGAWNGATDSRERGGPSSPIDGARGGGTDVDNDRGDDPGVGSQPAD